MKSTPWSAHVARGLAVMLSLSLLGAAMIKAQGCKRPDASPSEQATPITPGASNTPTAASESDAAADASTSNDAAQDPAPTPLKVFPATKSGMFPSDLEPVPPRNKK